MKKVIEYYIANIPHKGKRHIVRVILKLLPMKSIRSFYGPIMRSNPSDKTNVYAISGEYGRIISNHVESLSPESVFIDIGANYGIFSFLAAKHLTLGKVISFEPNPYIYKYFLENLKLNNPDNVVSFHCAVGEEDSFLKLQFDENHSGVSHVKTEVNNKENSALQHVNVPVFNINKWNFLSKEIQDSDINIKIDVEGYEYNIIKTLTNAPWFTQVKSIIVEIDDVNLRIFGATAKNIYDDLENIGFQSTYGINTNAHYDEIFVKSTGA